LSNLNVGTGLRYCHKGELAIDEITLAHLKDLDRRGSAGSFLTPAQAIKAKQYFVGQLILLGGFKEAERVIPVFGDAAHPERYLAAIKLIYRTQDCLSHRDILGAALGLGLARTVLGDIVVGEGEAHLVCLRHVAEFICENLSMAGRIGLKACMISLDELPEPNRQIEKISCTVASLRLDVILSQAFRLSRGKAEEILRLGLVQLAHEECRNGAKPVRQGDILSVRGYGRAQLLEIGGESKKGRTWITIGIFI